MLNITTAWITLYALAGLLTGYQLNSGHADLILIERLWAIVLAISFTFLIFRALRAVILAREIKAYQRWLETP